MKQIIKNWCPLLVAFTAVFSLVGCSKNASPLSTSEFKTQQAATASVSGSITLSREAADTPTTLRRKNGTHLVVYQSLQRGQRQLLITESADGHTWSEPQLITHQALTATNPTLAESPDGQLFLSYASNQNETWELFITQSTDAKQWATPRKMEVGIEQAQAPALLWHQNQLILAFQAMQGGIYLSTSLDGQNWSEAKQVADKGESPALHFNQATQRYLLLTEGESKEGWNLFIQTSKNLSQWSSSQQLTRHTRARWGRLTQDGPADNLVYSVQQENGSWNIVTAKTTDGVKWSKPQALIQNGLRNASPQLLTSPTQPLLVWSMGGTGRNSSVVLAPVRL